MRLLLLLLFIPLLPTPSVVQAQEGIAGAAGRDEPVVLATPTGNLHGSLRIPAATDGPCPVVLFLAGSGPTDRDGNSAMVPGKNNMLRQLAGQLAARGIASLRYDKRGVGQSADAGLSEADLRFDHFIDDAEAWCRLLQEDARFTTLVVAGHSQGAQVGALAAWRVGAHGLALMAGTGRPLFEVLEEQLARQLPVRNRVKARALMDSLRRGVLVPEPPQELMILFRPSVQAYLVSWQNHDPRRAVGRFDGPVTIIQGSTDQQVLMKDALALAVAQPRARLVKVEGHNHIFKAVDGENPLAHALSMGDSTLVVAPEVPQALAELVQQADDYRRSRQAALKRLASLNTDQAPGPWPAGDLGPGRRTAYWARRYLAAGTATYCFGLAEEGYAARGLLLQDAAMDCVSFVYRCTELARSRNHAEALLWALRTRFNGADPAEVVDARGRVDYDSPRHLDYSLDMVRSGVWGRDITPGLSGAIEDEEQTPRPGPGGMPASYAAGRFHFVPGENLDPSQLRDGDIAWLVLNPDHPAGKKLRREHGLVIGHLGVLVRDGGQVLLVHAAASPLEGHYDRPGVVSVPLLEYLERVDKFSGVMVTRLP